MGVCLVMKYMIKVNQIAKTTIAIYIGDILVVVHYISNITKHSVIIVSMPVVEKCQLMKS